MSRLGNHGNKLHEKGKWRLKGDKFTKLFRSSRGRPNPRRGGLHDRRRATFAGAAFPIAVFAWTHRPRRARGTADWTIVAFAQSARFYQHESADRRTALAAKAALLCLRARTMASRHEQAFSSRAPVPARHASPQDPRPAIAPARHASPTIASRAPPPAAPHPVRRSLRRDVVSLSLQIRRAHLHAPRARTRKRYASMSGGPASSQTARPHAQAVRPSAERG